MTTTSSVFISNNKNIAVFYHVYQYGDWLKLVSDQIKLLHITGLYEACSFIHIGINGQEPFPFNNKKIKIQYNKDSWSEETQTLNSLRNFCEQNDDWNILYFHTKGITRLSQETYDWRKIMEYFCIEKWKESIEILNDYNTVGSLYMDECYYGFFPHYSGNFWWAKSEYIRTLDHSYLDSGIRQNREFWIGTGKGLMYSFLTTGLNHYAHCYPRELYTDSLDPLLINTSL